MCECWEIQCAARRDAVTQCSTVSMVCSDRKKMTDHVSRLLFLLRCRCHFFSPSLALTLFSLSYTFLFLSPPLFFLNLLASRLLQPTSTLIFSLTPSIASSLHHWLPPSLLLIPPTPSCFSPGRLVIDTYKLPGGSGIVCDPSLSSPARRRFVI